MVDLSAALELAVEAAGAARVLLLAECARPDGPRGERGHCEVDLEAEELIRARLLAGFPSWGYLGEETGAQSAAPGEEHIWIVDPNDGTSSMQRGYRGHAVSIAVVRSGVPVLGVVWAVDAPDDDGDLFTWAEGGDPPRRNGASFERVDWPAQLGDADVVAVSEGGDRNPVGNLACLAPTRYQGVPSIAYRLALAAAGDFAATVSIIGPSAWDYAAGHALLRGAGGVMVDEAGREITYDADGRSITGRVFGGGAAGVAWLQRQPWERVPRSGFGEAVPAPSLAPARPLAGRLAHDPGVLQRAQGCLLGQIAGDSLGALVEFQPAEQIARQYPAGEPRLLTSGGPHQILAGQPTDDSELALLLGRTLLRQDDFDPSLVAASYARWYHGWTHADELEPCGHQWCRPFDVGSTTSQALNAITPQDVALGLAAQTARVAANTDSQANGALMRVSPIGIWGAQREPEQVAEAARQDSAITHPHPVCQDASASFAVSVAAAIRDGLSPEQTYRVACATAVEPTVRAALAAARTSPPEDFFHNQGWVLTALQNAYYRLLHAPDLTAGVIETVRAGGDTDTNAAICGALLGAVHGARAIPAQWRRLVVTCRPLAGTPGVRQPRPALYWPTDALILAERLVGSVSRPSPL